MTGRRRSLSARLVAAALVWLALLLAGGGAVLAWAFQDSAERQFALRLDALARAAIAALDVAADGQMVMARPLGDPRFDQVYSGWYWQVSSTDGRLLRSRSLWDQRLTAQGGHAGLAARRADGPNGEALLVAERDVRLGDGGGEIHVLVAGDLAEVSQSVRRFHMLLFAALGVLGLGAAGAVVVQVRFGLSPLRAMLAELAAVRRGEKPRLAGDYPAEVAPLAAAMNGVLDDDAQLIERARTHVGNLAHGLKTPLAVLGAELAGDPDPAVVSAQLDAMRRQIAHHLGRAAAVAGAGRAVGGRVAVAPVAADIAAALGKIFADRGLVIDLAVADEVCFHGDAEDLAEMLGNLMENACKWARSTIRVMARERAGRLEVEVADDGPGLSPQQAASAALRGKRLDEKAEGWGLGLAIVADLVAVNGGAMDFRRSSLGGLSVVLDLP